MSTQDKINKYLVDPNVVSIYQFGSRVYGSHHENSDYDYIIIVKDFFDSGDINIHVFSRIEFIMALERCDIQALECMFLNDKFILKQETKYNIAINKSRLRTSISTITSNSYVKCKKKLIVTGDYDLNVGLKSFFHSLRILDFGIQLATEQKIYNYGSMNYVYDDIRKMSETLHRDQLWNAIDSKYREFYNKQSSLFKSLCPKDLTQINKKAELVNLMSKNNIPVTDDIINQIVNIFEK